MSGKVVGILKQINPSLLDKLHATPGRQPCNGIEFFAPSGKSMNVPFKVSEDLKAAGYTIKRVDFDNFLIDEVRKTSIELLENVAVSSLVNRKESITVFSDRNKVEVNAKMVVLADGGQSVLSSKQMGYTLEASNFAAGIRGYYKGVSGMNVNNYIELHFLPEMLPGYLWIFPLGYNMSNVGLALRKDKIKKRNLQLKPLLNHLLNNDSTLKKRFNNAELIGGLKGCGLPMAYKKQKLSQEKVLVVGDAGWLIDPFTGEGIGNAMIAGKIAAEEATKAIFQSDFTASSLHDFDKRVYNALGNEFSISKKMIWLLNFPFLFNLIVNKANQNPRLLELMSCMFHDLDKRAQLKKPGFYLDLLFNK